MNTLPKTILVPVDFSESSIAPLLDAAAWAEQSGGRLFVLHVIPRPNWRILDERKLRTDLLASVKKRLTTLVTDTIGPTVGVDCEVVEGTAHEEIVRLARSTDADLIAIATHGHGGLMRFFLGSTTERVVRVADCPVLVVRRPRGWPSGVGVGPHDYESILVGTDFMPANEPAVAAAVTLATHGDAEVLISHVIDDSDYTSYGMLFEDRRARIERACRRELALLQERIPAGIRSRVLLEEGVPSARIRVLAEAHCVDLVVIGPRGEPGHLLGATAERIVRGAPCSVYVAKDRGARET